MKNRKKRTISIRLMPILLAVGLVIAIVLGVTKTTTNTWKIGIGENKNNTRLSVGSGQTYTSLQEAINAANDGDTITLMSNIESNSAISINKAITLDLNGHSIKNTATTGYAIEVSDYNIKINDSSTAKTGKIEGANGILVNTGTLILDSGSIIGNGTTGDGIVLSGIKPDGCGKVIIKGGTVLGNNCGIVGTYSSNDNGASVITVTGGVITGENYGIYSEGASENYYPEVRVNITGGTIVGKGNVHSGIYNGVGSVLTIGEDDGIVNTTSPVISGGECGIDNYGTMNYYDGLIKGKADTIYYTEDGKRPNVPDGYKIDTTTEQNEEGYYTTTLREEVGNNSPKLDTDELSSSITDPTTQIYLVWNNEPVGTTMRFAHVKNAQTGEIYYESYPLSEGGLIKELQPNTKYLVYVYFANQGNPNLGSTDEIEVTTQIDTRPRLDNEAYNDTEMLARYIERATWKNKEYYDYKTDREDHSYIYVKDYEGNLIKCTAGVEYQYQLDGEGEWIPCEEEYIYRSERAYRIPMQEGIHSIQVKNTSTHDISAIYYYKLDKTAPIISVDQASANGVNQVQPTITVAETLSGLKTNTIEYVFSTSPTTPTEEYQTETLRDGEVQLTSPEGVNGTYYLHIKGVTDNAGNNGRAYTSGAYVLKSDPTPTTYTVTFNPNGGSVNPTSKPVTSGSTYGTLPTPTREGYTFEGWYTGSNGTGTKIEATTTVTATSNHTLYAKWTKNTPAPTPTVTVTKVTLNAPSLHLTPGAEVNLTATVYYSDSTTDHAVSWESTNSSVVSVNNGKVTVAAGATAGQTATITATSTKDGTKSASCTVTVMAETEKTVTGITLDKSELNLDKNQTATLVPTILPADATNQKVMWTSSKESVATVDDNGKVTAVGEGEAIITATTEDGGLTATCKVTVTDDDDSQNNNGNNNGGNNNGNDGSNNNGNGGSSNSSGGSSVNGGSGSGTGSSSSGSASKQDGSLANSRIPQTGISHTILIVAAIVAVNGMVMFVRYRKMNY